MANLIPPTPKPTTEHVNVFEPGRTIIIKPTRMISFASIIEMAKAEQEAGKDESK